MLTLSKFSSSCIINKHIKYLLFIFIGTVSMSTTCSETEYVTVYNQSGENVFISLAMPPVDPNNMIDYLSFIGANQKLVYAYTEFYEKQDWYLIVVYQETVDKYGLAYIRDNDIYDELIRFDEREVLNSHKIIYNGNKNERQNAVIDR